MENEIEQYFANGRKKIVKAVPNEDFTLTLTFDNGEVKLFDCNPLIEKDTVFEPLMNYDNFKRVHVDTNGSSIAWDIDPEVDSEKNWSNVIDLCADSLYMESIKADV